MSTHRVSSRKITKHTPEPLGCNHYSQTLLGVVEQLDTDVTPAAAAVRM